MISSAPASANAFTHSESGVSPEKHMDVLSVPMRIEAPAASTIADIYFP